MIQTHAGSLVTLPIVVSWYPWADNASIGISQAIDSIVTGRACVQRPAWPGGVPILCVYTLQAHVKFLHIHLSTATVALTGSTALGQIKASMG